MKAVRTVLLVGLAVVAGLTVYLLARNPDPSPLPADADHRVFLDADTCLVCHDSSSEQPRMPDHPIGRDCLRCHR